MANKDKRVQIFKRLVCPGVFIRFGLPLVQAGVEKSALPTVLEGKLPPRANISNGYFSPAVINSNNRCQTA